MIKCVSAAFLFVRLHLLLASINHDIQLYGNYGLLPLGLPLGPSACSIRGEQPALGDGPWERSCTWEAQSKGVRSCRDSGNPSSVCWSYQALDFKL